MPPAALHPETPVKSTVTKFVALLGSVIGFTALAVWATAWQLFAMRTEAAKTNERLASIEHFMRHEAVTQSQAERYAYAFERENRRLNIVVPDPADYRDKPKG
jgi:hypothetical protein